jgi:DNA-binding MarR family transcriptional regulator
LSDGARTPGTDAAKMMKSIRRIVRAIDMRSKKVARETGLTIPQIVVLHAVKERGMVTTAALSRHADLSPATTVTILDKLESRGLVTRQRSAEDRRIVHTTLTEKGAEILTDAPPLFDWAFSRGFADLSEAEQHKILKALATVADLLDPGEPRPDPKPACAEAGTLQCAN